MTSSDVDTRSAAIKELGDIIAPLAARCNITKVYLFGSRARDDYTDDSDY
ncbi:MAG: nucleotidyltransferase domain-containing protein, partial [Thermoplasmata archaeon]|nr:nucleotidyltransferase domain-containing protein [Thermoplasmata archaeon]